MKKLLALCMAIFLLLATITIFASAAKEEYYEYKALYTASAPVIDGDISDEVWEKASWAEIKQAIENSPAWGKIPAKFKVVHDGKYLYLAAEVKDDTIAEWDSIAFQFSDVRSEEPRLGPNNVVSFRRINEEFHAETSVGKNGDFSAPEREGDNLVSLVEWKMTMITDDSGASVGYVAEAKLEYLLEFPHSIYFNAQWGNAEPDYSGDSAWNPYWGWNLLGISTTCYGDLVFLTEEESKQAAETAAPETAAPETSAPETSATDTAEQADEKETALPGTEETEKGDASSDTVPSQGTEDKNQTSPVLWIVLAAIVVLAVVVMIVMKTRKRSD